MHQAWHITLCHAVAMVTDELIDSLKHCEINQTVFFVFSRCSMCSEQFWVDTCQPVHQVHWDKYRVCRWLRRSWVDFCCTLVPELEVDVPGTISHSLNIRSVNVFFLVLQFKCCSEGKVILYLIWTLGPALIPISRQSVHSHKPDYKAAITFARSIVAILSTKHHHCLLAIVELCCWVTRVMHVNNIVQNCYMKVELLGVELSTYCKSDALPITSPYYMLYALYLSYLM